MASQEEYKMASLDQNGALKETWTDEAALWTELPVTSMTSTDKSM